MRFCMCTVLFAVLALAGCDCSSNDGADGAVAGDGGGLDGMTGLDGGTMLDGSTSGLGGTREEFCSGSGTVALVGDSVGDGGSPVCTGGLAERTFRYALCVCERTTIGSEICTDAFDSSEGPYEPGAGAPDCGDGTGWPLGGQFGGSIGVNGRYCGS
ncbi:MAG: hypothetical protein GWO02_11705, partial [Gammaproteobacteria bacterium]|nr:hypothetical protein [Gammaproteobacteria bacterium]